jgi:hypothetical protein
MKEKLDVFPGHVFLKQAGVDHNEAPYVYCCSASSEVRNPNDAISNIKLMNPRPELYRMEL